MPVARKEKAALQANINNARGAVPVSKSSEKKRKLSEPQASIISLKNEVTAQSDQ